MPPQPLSRVCPSANVVIGNVGDYPLSRYPKLAVLVAEAISSWSNVEAFMLRLFISLMGGAEDKAATVFLALETQSAKSAAINAVARELREDHRKLLKAILSLIKTHQKARDKIAHGTWGYSPQLADSALLIDPRAAIGCDGRTDRSRIFVYREGDFKEIIAANERLAGYGLRLKFVLEGHVANRDGGLYAELCAEPEIREKLTRLDEPERSS